MNSYSLNYLLLLLLLQCKLCITTLVLQFEGFSSVSYSTFLISIMLAPVSPETRQAIELLQRNVDIREDPKRRRELAAAVFSSAIAGKWRLDEAGDLIVFGDFLMLTLHDPWSEIRKESANSLAQWSDSLSEKFCNYVLHLLLDHLHEKEQWQVVHGNMLGVTALRKHIDPTTDGDILMQVKAYCLFALAHQTLLVRESARLCFSAFFMQDTVVSELEDMVESYVTVDNQVMSEEHSFSLQSFLDCLADYLKAKPSEFLEFIRNRTIVHQTSEAADRAGPCSKALQVVDLCMNHVSSTVRFAAGSLLAKIFFACSGTDTDIAEYAVTMISAGMCSSSSEGKWRRREGFLIVAHDILVASSKKYLDLICRSEVFKIIPSRMSPSFGASDCSVMVSAQYDPLLCLIMAVRRTLPSILQNQTSFELRRIGSQMLPPLVRCSLFCATYSHLLGGEGGCTPRSNELLASFGDVYSEFSEFPSLTGTDVLDDDIFVFCFAAEVAKTVKLIVEAIGSFILSSDSDGVLSGVAATNADVPYTHKFRNGSRSDVSWAMLVPRRLGEEDCRLEIWAEVLGASTSLACGQVCRMGEILLDIFDHRVLPKLYSCIGKFNSGIEIYSQVIAADVIEGIIICTSVSQFVRYTDDIHPDVLAALSYAVRLLCATQVHVMGPPVSLEPDDAIATSDRVFINRIAKIKSNGLDSLEKINSTTSLFLGSLCLLSISDATGPALTNTVHGHPRRSSQVAKYALLDRWVCEAIAPVLAAVVRMLSERDLFLLLCVCVLWLERISIDSQWLSIKASTKNSILDFIAAAILRIELLLIAGVHLSDLKVLHTLLLVSVPIIKRSLCRDDHGVSVQLIKLCRVSRGVMILCFLPEATEAFKESLLKPFEDIQCLVKEYLSRVNFDKSRAHSETKRNNNVVAVSEDSETGLEAININVLSCTSDHSTPVREVLLEDDDSFSDWDESDNEETAVFEINIGSTPQKLLRKKSSIYLAEELDLFLAAAM